MATPTQNEKAPRAPSGNSPYREQRADRIWARERGLPELEPVTVGAKFSAFGELAAKLASSLE